MKHELLAPAGSLDICKAVIRAGADAVYLGGEKYGARAFARNFDEAEVLQALDYAHLRDRKIFLTVNTLLKNLETGKELYDYLKPFYRNGLDAIIVQDYGVFQFARKYFPELPVHISTQMSVSGVYGARFLQEQGASRIVTARELSLDEIRAIYQETGIEIESFIHGALCYCYSGQCLMSSMLGGRSGNRGRCAQPCRLAYEVCDADGRIYHKKEKYPLSPKDLCTLDLIPKLCEAGIYSFKIEGRMKSLEYAAGVTSVYRDYLDRYETDAEHYQTDPEDLQYLLSLGNRNGFTRGYYEMRNGPSMITRTESSHTSGQAKDVFRGVTGEKLPVHAKAVIHQGEPMSLTLSYKTDRVCVTGEEVQTAESHPLEEAEARKRLSKTGETSWLMAELEIDLQGACFVPVKHLNELRRNGFEALERKLLKGHERMIPEADPEEFHLFTDGEPSSAEVKTKTVPSALSAGEGEAPCLDVFVSTPDQLREVLKYSWVRRISLDCASREPKQLQQQREQIHAADKEAAFCFPYVFRADTAERFRTEAYKEVLKTFDRLWVRSYDSLGFALAELGVRPEQIGLDYGLYVYSVQALEAFQIAGLEQYTASLELNRKELRHMPNSKAEFILYGYTPLMISAQCVYKNYDRCRKEMPEQSGKRRSDRPALYLKDRYFKQFLIKENCKDCYNIIYNSQPLYLFHQADVIRKLGFGSVRIALTTENESEIKGRLQDYRHVFLEGRTVKAPSEKDSFTNGHFNRGVD